MVGLKVKLVTTQAHMHCVIASVLLQAAVEEGIVAGGGSTLLKLAQKVDDIIATLENDEQKVGAEIVRRALSYPLKLIANNAGVNGSVVVQKVGCYPQGYCKFSVEAVSMKNYVGNPKFSPFKALEQD